MLATILSVGLSLLAPSEAASRFGAAIIAVGETPTEGLSHTLMKTFDAMKDSGKGLFLVDVSAVVAPYFPVGQPFAETEAVIRREHLGSLRAFKGAKDPGGGTMYVTKFSLMSELYSDVYVVVHFEFDGDTRADMVLKSTSAFIRATNM